MTKTAWERVGSYAPVSDVMLIMTSCHVTVGGIEGRQRWLNTLILSFTAVVMSINSDIKLPSVIVIFSFSTCVFKSHTITWDINFNPRVTVT